MFGKYLVYDAWWKADHHKTDFNMPTFRVLFVTSTPSRARELIAANKAIANDGTRLFMFIDRRSLLEHSNIIEAPWINGLGETTALLE